MTDTGPNTWNHPAALTDEELLSVCETQRTRRGGPGGQHRNKTETAIVVTHLESGVSGQASERRSQKANKEEAVFRLRLNLAVAFRTLIDVANDEVEPGELWKRRASGRKMMVSTSHRDFPALIAEALDWVSSFDFELGAAARRLGLSTSQLVKFLKLCPEAWQWIQQQRHQRGLPRLK